MNYHDKTKEDLIVELEELKRSHLDLKASAETYLLDLRLAEKALQESEERVRVLFEGAPDAIILADTESGIISDANRSACLLTGRKLEEIVGMHHEKLYPVNGRDYSAARFNIHIHESLVAEKASLVEHVVSRPDGTRIPVEILAQVIKLKDQRVLMGTFRDISGRKHAEAIFRDIIEKNPMSIQILDMEGYTVQTNSAHTKLFGAKTPQDYSIFKDAQLLKQGMGVLFDQIKNGEVVYFPDSYFNVHDVDPSFPNVSTWIKAIGFTLNDSFGKPERIVLMHENITGRKLAEAMFQDIIDKNPMSIQIVDKDGITLLGNPAYTLLFGSVPPPDFSIFDDLQQKSPELQKLILRAKSGEIVHLPDLYFNTRDVSPELPDVPLWIRAIIFPLNDSSGKPERFVLMHENITERKLAENEIMKLNESLELRVAERTSQLDAINRELAFHLSEVEQFTYIASHDLQEPLRTLTTYTQLINEEYAGKLDADGNKYIEFISGSASRMRALVTALLEYSLLGKEAVLASVDCNQVIGEVLADMADSIARSNACIRFEKLPVLNCYETELRQLFQNLINNAVKFRKKEVHPKINISAEYLLNAWRFSVEDNGIGIAEKDKEKIFTIFKRMHNRNEYEGTGIGLAHCKKIVEMHGGKIWVESTPGKGSKFIFTIPRRV
ncbi:MAG: PAS domain S-box protein [Bacteroidetes bacterium]|nr:PAS domain S-box protein [Bacteroidota bacterium]